MARFFMRICIAVELGLLGRIQYSAGFGAGIGSVSSQKAWDSPCTKGQAGLGLGGHARSESMLSQPH